MCRQATYPPRISHLAGQSDNATSSVTLLALIIQDPLTQVLECHDFLGTVPSSIPVSIAPRFFGNFKNEPSHPFRCFRVTLLPVLPFGGSGNPIGFPKQNLKNRCTLVRGRRDMVRRNDDVHLITRTLFCRPRRGHRPSEEADSLLKLEEACHPKRGVQKKCSCRAQKTAPDTRPVSDCPPRPARWLPRCHSAPPLVRSPESCP